MQDITRRRLLWSLPFATAAVAGGGFLAMLSGIRKGNFDPKEINTPILNKPIPAFSLSAQPPSTGFNQQELQQQTEPVLINFFASWCIPCLTEMSMLQQLSSHISIWGIAYKDKQNSVSGFLKRNGNPYQRIGQDNNGNVGIEWGVSGVPESFLVMPGGIIKWHYPKPLTVNSTQTLLSLLK
ncbi:DsbE family thiol:disulfide interchange protein [Commensalibacter papalotli (ex Servin-Garciduenas et al. 2014)]|uniref:Cytochrome c biogenesis thiol:disulfide interchange protein DsbE n=1 Tax=Commensalibacter papalotli (ex Servin-Garciduenas et al. 2014) TaxID=1208583 RepID=W7DW37_9PROT|nr:DsbE family thiol:disulfide interchange protein [Commensalibacter papalotli (ex Servin-Garciduenas et al. 2014)]EUK18428.1 cytochrome c biogenesis thiol:disulfide interchange protein DsbE [Commensalibacter papalotli (ex Servin-Garciduenas et al. 2014)]